MQAKEAILLIKDHNRVHQRKERFAVKITEALALAVLALEKQIPKKPYLKDLFELGTMQGIACPGCDTVILNASEKYCKNCGQALDWSTPSL